MTTVFTSFLRCSHHLSGVHIVSGPTQTRTVYNEEEKERPQQLSAQLTAVAGPLQQIDEDAEQTSDTFSEDIKLQIEDINQNAWARQLQHDCISHLLLYAPQDRDYLTYLGKNTKEQYAKQIKEGNVFLLKCEFPLQLLLLIILHVLRCPILYYAVKFSDLGKINEAEDVEGKSLMTAYLRYSS